MAHELTENEPDSMRMASQTVYENAPNREEEPVNIAARGEEHPEVAAGLPLEIRNTQIY
jgi:hypothetical protein